MSQMASNHLICNCCHILLIVHREKVNVLYLEFHSAILYLRGPKVHVIAVLA